VNQKLLGYSKLSNFQAPKSKFQTNANDRNPKFKTGAMIAENQLSDQHVSVIGNSNLDIFWDLVLEIWNFSVF
jgi:hypothetical protein